jgi:hypothetical protein
VHSNLTRAGIVDDILAGSFAVWQSETILARSGEAGKGIVAALYPPVIHCRFIRLAVERVLFGEALCLYPPFYTPMEFFKRI